MVHNQNLYGIAIVYMSSDGSYAFIICLCCKGKSSNDLNRMQTTKTQFQFGTITLTP